MVQTKMGRYWEQAKRWFVCKVWSFKTKSGRKEEVSKMRAHCKSKTDVRRSKKICRCKKTSESEYNVGPKPTNVATFAKRKKAATGGYFGPSISGEYGGVNLSNSSSKKYYGNILKGFKIS